MKKTAILSITLIALTTVLFSGCYYGDLNFTSHQVDDHETIMLNDAKKVEISAISSDINIIVEDTDQISASYVGTIESTSNKVPRLVVGQSGNTILIEIDYPKKAISIGDDRTTLTVTIPSEFDESLYAHTISGEIQVEELIMENLDLSTTSGDILCGKILSDDIDLNSVSGNIDIQKCMARTVEGDTVLGDITIDIPDDLHLDLESSTVSGDVHTKDGHADSDSQETKMDLGTVSGDIRIDRF